MVRTGIPVSTWIAEGETIIQTAIEIINEEDSKHS